MTDPAPHGKLVLVVGPSGSGKGTLVKYVRELYPELAYSISCTTRAMRPGESDGAQYHFVTQETFEEKIAAGEFLEWAEFGGNRYGTLKSEVAQTLLHGGIVLLEIELQGARQIQRIMPKDELLTVFVDAGSWDALEARVRARAPMSDGEIEKRRSHYATEMAFKSEADVVIENHDGKLEEAKKEFEQVLLPLLGESKAQK